MYKIIHEYRGKDVLLGEYDSLLNAEVALTVYLNEGYDAYIIEE